MKRKFFLAIALPIVAIIAVIACSKDVNEPNEIKTKKNLLTLKSFERYGQIHNELMDNIKNNFVKPEGITGYHDMIDYIKNFNKQYILKTNSLTNEEKEQLTSESSVISLDKYKYFVDNRVFVNKVFENNTKLHVMSATQNDAAISALDTVDFNIYEKLDEAYSLSLIDTFEYSKLKIIADKAYDNITGEISDSDFYDCIVDIARQWETKGYTEDSNFGKTLGVTLAIGIASNEWWEQNPDARIVEQDTGEVYVLQAAVGVVATDVGGAAFGALFAWATGGDIGTCALGGAFGASSGIGRVIGGIGKAIWNWLF